MLTVERVKGMPNFLGGPRRLDLAVSGLHARGAGGRKTERHADLAAENRRFEAAHGDVDANPLLQPDAVKVVAVGPIGMLGIGAGVCVLEEHARHAPLGHALEVVDRQHAVEADHRQSPRTNQRMS